MVKSIAAYATLSIVISCGSAAEAAVFAFGEGERGQLGLGSDYERKLVPTPIDMKNIAGRRIVHADAGYNHNLLLADDGTVFSFGWNISGATGLGFDADTYTDIARPIEDAGFAGRRIVQTEAASTYSLLLDEEGIVYAMGDEETTGRGLNPFDDTQTVLATPVDTTHLMGRTVTQISANYRHSLLLTDDGTVLGFGVNQSGNRTGIYSYGLEIRYVTVPTPISNTEAIADKTITQVSAGTYHSLLLADDGSVFTFGEDGVADYLVPTAIDLSLLGDQTVTRLAAGGEYSLLLTDDGNVYSYGSNHFGVTGRGIGSGTTSIPAPINPVHLDGRKITDIAAGDNHSLLLTEDGTVYGFGRAQLTGTGQTSGNVLVPTPIDMTPLGGHRVVGIAAGAQHSLLVTVPEPSSIVMVCLGLLAAIWRLPKHS